MVNLPDLPNLPNLPDVGTVVEYLKTTATLLDAVTKLRRWLPKRKKGAKRDLEKELDALEADLILLAGELTKFLKSHENFLRAIIEVGPKSVDSLIKLINQFGVVNRLTVDHERRLLALEQRPEVRGKRVPKKKRRRR
jgi:hypothetical protein